jgi:protein-disulfide isomerase
VICIILTILNKYVFKDPHSPIHLNQNVTTNRNDIIFGNPNSPETIYMFSSYKCGYCRQFFRTVYPKLKANYIDKGNLKLVVKLVEPSQDPDMMYALEVGIGINQFGDFRKLHELLLHDNNVVYTDDFKDLCDDVLRTNSDIAECILKETVHNYLKENNREFTELKLTGTPSFIINQKLYKGYLEYNEIEKIIRN